MLQGLEVGLGGLGAIPTTPPPPLAPPQGFRVWGLGFRGPRAIKRLIYDSTYFSGPGRAPYTLSPQNQASQEDREVEALFPNEHGSYFKLRQVKVVRRLGV